MKRFLALFLGFAMLLTACSGTNSAAPAPAPAGSSAQGDAASAAAAAPAKKMTSYSAVYGAELTGINYLKNGNTEEIQLAYNCMDGMVEFDQYGLLIPSLATEWSVSADQLVYTFKLRPGVKWYTYEGKEYGEVKAQDFVDAAKWALTKANTSKTCQSIYNNIAGARDFYDEKSTDFATVGIKAVDDATVEYTLLKPVPYFVKMLSFPVFYPANGKFMEECGDQFGTSNDTLLYCGPYLLKTYEPEYQRVLVMNENYWNKDILSIQEMTFRYNKEASANGPELFLRGETMDVELPGSIMDEWMNDPVKKAQMRPIQLTNMSYFMLFNFEPKYEAEYGPENWEVVVNNVNFRKAMFHAFDRDAAAMTLTPYNYQEKVLKTYTRKEFVQSNNVDYTLMSGLDEYTNGVLFDKEKALSYKKKAMEELSGKATFPVKVVMPYNTGKVDSVSRVQVIEQQLESVLGTDFIDILLVSYPATNYNAETRNKGVYSFMETGWGPDFADPMSFFDPLLKTSLAKNWSRLYLAKEYLQPDGVGTFEHMALKANAEVADLQKRYEMFAEAEKFLLDEALVVPFYVSGGGFKASYVDPFSGYCGQFGRNAKTKLKGVALLDHPMSTEEYEAAKVAYLAARDKARTESKYN